MAVSRSNPQDRLDPCKVQRRGRQKGCSVYITADQLAKAWGGPVPENLRYRVQGWGFRRALVIFEDGAK